MKMTSESAKTIVVKIGSRVMSKPDGGIDDEFLERFVGDIAALHERGHRIALVSSGAIRTGAPVLGLDRKKIDISGMQAAAAVGQGILISKYIKLFQAHGIIAGQALFTPDIASFRKKYLNARNTLRALLNMGAVPVINENDTVAYEEIKFGDNDTLSAITAILVEADMLILLSDVDGLYTGVPGSPGVEKIRRVEEITDEIRRTASGPATDGGFGGMITKINAAEAAMESGIAMVIAHGREENVLENILAGTADVTTFAPAAAALPGRKKWLAFGCRIEGGITVNEGAKTAIEKSGGSLLPVGVVSISGEFDHGDCVGIHGPDGKIFARGLTNYSSVELGKIKGLRSANIEGALGYVIADEVVHRDDLVLT